MKDSQRMPYIIYRTVKYIKESNERFSTSSSSGAEEL